MDSCTLPCMCRLPWIAVHYYSTCGQQTSEVLVYYNTDWLLVHRKSNGYPTVMDHIALRLKTAGGQSSGKSEGE
ncbi:hypothetical protein CEXT_140481 [Caerostris extrusa]|uniref:Uncharacterized protein n=1 Tax=Caerostris extrusa TaxID=172846 RepID=A0AAV4Y0Q4_CAEEX|nr:hypothetical protein CEXT_140481 [Caerostris extrusa]